MGYVKQRSNFLRPSAETTEIYRDAGLLALNAPGLRARPSRAPIRRYTCVTRLEVDARVLTVSDRENAARNFT